VTPPIDDNSLIFSLIKKIQQRLEAVENFISEIRDERIRADERCKFLKRIFSYISGGGVLVGLILAAAANLGKIYEVILKIFSGK
jgi:hypothetical protein